MEITFYHQQLLRMRDEVYPREYLIEKVMEAKKFMDTNYASDICLADIACKASISKFHFLRLFKQVYGITPNQYLVTVRIEKAKALLQSGVTVTEACFSVGFDSITSFTGLFKKVTGYTPSAVLRRLVPPVVITPIIRHGFYTD